MQPSYPGRETTIQEDRARAKATWEKLATFGVVEAMAGKVPTDQHDLIMGMHALRCWPVSGEPWGLPDQCVIWYKDEAVCIPWEEFVRDYRVLDNPLNILPPSPGMQYLNALGETLKELSDDEAAKESTLAGLVDGMTSHAQLTQGDS